MTEPLKWQMSEEAIAADRAQLAQSNPHTQTLLRMLRKQADHGDRAAREACVALAGDIEIAPENRAILEGIRD